MFRIGLKFSLNGYNFHRINKHGCEKVYVTARCYKTRSKVKYDQRWFKDGTVVSRTSLYNYSTESSKSDKSNASAGTLVTLGAITIGAFGILTYAKNDSEFRATLEGWIPGTDRAITIIFMEESSYLDYIINFFESLKKTILDSLFGGDSKPAPRPTFVPPTSESPLNLSTNKPKSEIRSNKEIQKKSEVETVTPISNETSTPDLHELEKHGGELATEAIGAFQKAACAVQEYNSNIISVIESSDSSIEEPTWDRLKAAQEKRTAALEEAEKKAEEAVKSLKQLRNSIDDPNIEATPGQKTIARRNISKILADVDEAKKNFEQELANVNISEKYWNSVKAAREKFHDELHILFPDINFNNKKITFTDEAFNLFVLHMYHKITFLQNELQKLQTVTDARVKSALRSDGNQEKIQEAIALEVTKEKWQLQNEFDKKMLQEKKVLDEEMRRQLTLQAQIHADHLREELMAKEREIERKINRYLSEQKEEESIKTKNQLAQVIGKLHGLDEALKNRLNAEKDASEAQLLWGACQALHRAVKSAPPGTAPEASIRPLESEINAIVKAAKKDDVFVNTAIKGIPEEAVKRGVYPEDALRERFLKVEQMAKKLALVPADGASLPIYLLSYIQSFLLVKAVSPIPKSELNDEPIDVDSLNTYDILQRARYWMNRGDLKMTLRYMNLLKGAPRSIARDWMRETQILLETQQAIDSLVAYAGANSLVFMGATDQKDGKGGK